MLIRELNWFRETVAAPRMQKLLENTVIPDGYTCITSMEISLFDGRSCGVESELRAEGYLYKNGKVEPYTFHTYDFEDTDFFQDHQSSIFLAEGTLHIEDALQDMEVSTRLQNLNTCANLFPPLKAASTLTVERQSLEFLKMLHLLHDTPQAKLDTLISTADSVRTAPPPSQEKQQPFDDHEER